MARFTNLGFKSLQVMMFALTMTAASGATIYAQSSLETLPQSPTLPPYNWFASTDKTGKNNDFFVIEPGKTRRVPLSSGTLERLWSTATIPEQLDLTLEAGPHRSQLLLSAGKASRGLLENKAFTFFPSLKGDPLAKLETGAALVATNRASATTKWFFQASVRPASPAVKAENAKGVTRRLFKLSIDPGEEKSIESWNTPGEIYEFSVASDGATPVDFDQLRLKASFDGQSAVDAPLLSLAGQVDGTGQIKNEVADFDGSRLVLHWPMPFKTAQLSLVNQGHSAVKLDVGARVSQFDSPPSPYRFCALQNSAQTVKGKPVPILDLKGSGAFVGLALSIKPVPESTKRTFAYLEGDEKIVADGKPYEGTGTEDFFSSAWYFPDKPFFHAFEGLTSKIALPPAISAYRFMIPDSLPFKKSLKFDFEQGNGNSTDDLKWTWTAFWYQLPPLTAAPNVKVETSTGTSAPVAPGDRWKIWVAIGVGIFLGVTSAVLRRRGRGR